MNKIFLYFSIIVAFIFQSNYASSKLTNILYCDTFNSYNIFNPNTLPYNNCYKKYKNINSNYYKIFLNRHNHILKVESYNKEGILQTIETYNYKRNKPHYSKKIYTAENDKYITINYFFGANIQINTPNKIIANRIYYKKISQYNKNTLYQISYYNKQGQLLVKVFYNNNKISEYKLRIFDKEKLDREVYYKGQGEYYRGKNRKWKKIHKWVNIFGVTGQLEFSFYNFEGHSNKVQYFIYYYNPNGILIRKEQFLINKNKVLALRNKINKLKKKGIKARVSPFPRGVYITPFLKQKLIYKNKTLALRSLISKNEMNHLVNIPKTNRSRKYRNLIKRMYRQLQIMFVPTKTKETSWYFKLNNKIYKIEYYKDNHLSKVNYYDNNGNIKKTDKYNWLGEKVFVEE